MLLMPDDRLAFFMAGRHCVTLKNAGAFLCRRRDHGYFLLLVTSVLTMLSTRIGLVFSLQ
ncbi:hypothetical protein B4923_03230 [Brenneria roseae subsp. americana]|uniref:Uncharacterized protein n=1 Tax=Brenneria roseae subsp. americana TaxID=1508507 RepID=A0A2U1U077_9GAMM|nr:hypothetical protein B4923_03230 [Brenneria roseae subsp. americana]